MAKSSKNRKTRSRQTARKSAKSSGSKSVSRQQQKKTASAMVFASRNYQLMLLGVALVLIGYIMMRVENEVDGFISLYVAPLIILGGYLEIIYAILWRPKTKQVETEESPA